MNNLMTIDLKQNSDVWPSLVAKALGMADAVEFNVLYKHPGRELDLILEQYGGVIIERVDDRYYYTSCIRVRFPLSSSLASLLKSKRFEDWINNLLEDPSFIKGSEEILGTISHEMMCGYLSSFFDNLEVNL